MMKKICLTMFLLTLTVAAGAREPKDKDKDQRRTATEVIQGMVSFYEGEFVPNAEAMPEDKYGFAPTNGAFTGVRTFGQMVKHVATVNFEMAAAILEERPPIDINGEAGPPSITTKADIVKLLKDSFVYLHKAVQTINEKNLVNPPVKSPFGEGTMSRLGLATGIVWHGYDHYGQLVEYLRMNGIIPPASR